MQNVIIDPRLPSIFNELAKAYAFDPFLGIIQLRPSIFLSARSPTLAAQDLG